jgi:ABC-type branched-subunit amino acid transport system ATPase component
VLSQTKIAGGDAGLPTGPLVLFGLGVDPITYPQRFAILALIVAVAVGLVLANLRRGPAGRRLLAVRANERAATALGINVGLAKLIAFAYGSAIAGLAGILFVTQFPVALFSIFDAFTSVPLVSTSVIGGIGYISGPVFGGIGQTGGILSQILSTISLGAVKYGPVILAGITLVVLLQAQDGLVPLQARDARRLARLVLGRRMPTRRARVTTLPQILAGDLAAPPPVVLEVSDLTVRLGAVTAVDHVDFRLASGEVIGVIGPNGAGKTTLIDALSGFVSLRAGTIALNSDDVASWSARRRAREGISRSFQSLELFEDMTVAENLLAACDGGGLWPWARDLIRPGTPTFTPAAAFAAREFGLEGLLDVRPSELTYGTRRLLAIVRAIASSPRVLLLDEPAAGLDEREREDLTVLIRRLATEWRMAILLVDHDVALVSNASDHMLALDAGKAVARGTPDDVRSHPTVVSSYLGSAAVESRGDGR